MTGCGLFQGVVNEVSQAFSGGKNATGERGNEEEFSISEKEMYKILKESGYGEGVDWSKQSDDDPSIAKSMDITKSREDIKKAYVGLYGDENEPGFYEKAWWDYIPDSYDLSGDVFPASDNFAGKEKMYNNSLEQGRVSDGDPTYGQSMDLSTVRDVANSFVYESVKDRFTWTDDLKEICDIADRLDVADFYSREAIRPMYDRDFEELSEPACMTAYYDRRILGYNMIGIPKFGPYEFDIWVWPDDGKPVGWVNELAGGQFMDENEVYENMGEWDFYDNVQASEKGSKIVKPKVPNGVLINQGKTTGLSKEQYIHTKLRGTPGKCGIIYYYGNGITVEISYYGGESGGTFKEALEICRAICRNK